MFPNYMPHTSQFHTSKLHTSCLDVPYREMYTTTPDMEEGLFPDTTFPIQNKKLVSPVLLLSLPPVAYWLHYGTWVDILFPSVGGIHVCDVTSLSLSPWQPDHFLSGSSDGTIRLYQTTRGISDRQTNRHTFLYL